MPETNGTPAPREEAELRLELHPDGDALVWAVVNLGEHTVRLWRQSNSWGWSMPQLLIAAEADSPTPLHLVPAAKLWTRNSPGTVELARQESARYVMRAGDFDPAARSAAEDLWERPVWVVGLLVSAPSAQAVEHGVWVGTVRGAEQRQSPPHPWLRPSPKPSGTAPEAVGDP